MRTQLLHDDVDERSWRLQRVDPTGWLVGSSVAGSVPTAGAVPGAPPAAAPDVPPGVEPRSAPRRRPRRTEAARIARERELARRRRRRQGRVLVVDRQSGPEVGAGSMGRRARPVSRLGRVADPSRRVGPVMPDSTSRIGRWGRLALTVLVALTLALIVGRVAVGSIAAAPAPELVDVTVRPGDTLWSIATSASPGRDPRTVIEDIRDFNGLSGDVVRVGEVLRVPVVAG